MCLVKRVPSCLLDTKQTENQTGRIQNFQNDLNKTLFEKNNHKQTSPLDLTFHNEQHVPEYILLPRGLGHIQIIHLPYFDVPDEEFIVTKQEREPWERG